MSTEVTKQRWNLLGHILRLDKKKTNQKSLEIHVWQKVKQEIPRKKRAKIYTTVNRDIKKTKKNNPPFSNREIKSKIDLHNIGDKGRN